MKNDWVKDTTTSDVLPPQVAFAQVDFDFYDQDALEFLDARMPAGARCGRSLRKTQFVVDQLAEAASDRCKFELPLA